MSENMATHQQLEEIAAYMASQINVPTIGLGGGYAPVGTIISYMGISAPQDYLICDGTIYDIADYKQLADHILANFGSYGFFGGNGTTTFAVPDLRGEFLRGTGTNSHTNQGSGENVGVHQDATEHIMFITGNNPIGQVGLRALFNTDFIDQYRNMSNKKTDSLINSPTTNAKFNDFNLDSIGTSSGKGAYFTSKPTNTSVLYCIKYNAAGDVYSTTEREVGTWIDGSKIYQLSGVINDPVNNSRNHITEFEGIIGMPIGLSTISIISGGAAIINNVYGSSTSYISVSVGGDNESLFVASAGAYIPSKVYYTIQYIKPAS